MRECLNCGRAVKWDLQNSSWECESCRFRLFPENHIQSMAYVRTEGDKRCWCEVPRGFLAVFQEVEL